MVLFNLIANELVFIAFPMLIFFLVFEAITPLVMDSVYPCYTVRESSGLDSSRSPEFELHVGYYRNTKETSCERRGDAVSLN